MSNNIFRTIFLIFISIFTLHAQISNPAKWKIYSSKSEVTINEEIDIIFEVSLEKGWYTYSVGKFESAPSASFKFNSNNSFELIGNIKPINDKEKNDEYIGIYRYFKDKGIFKQKIKVKTKNLNIKGSFEYFTCSSESGVCLPPFDEEFSIANVKVLESSINNIVNKVSEKVDTTPIKSIEVVKEIESSNKIIKSIKPVLPPQASLFQFFILAFLSGLAALVTPCVFPMIPMTVTFFLNQSKNRSEAIFKALLYGFSIIAIYTIIGFLVSRFLGAETANFISTHWAPNLFFFAVFLIFAASFLGMFEITLPSSFVNKIDQQADKGGYMGIFFMAFTLVLVSFSCTGPIVGSVLVESANGQLLKPIIGMFGFSLAFALPFTLFAIFPSWLSGLPKSGGWLNTVKVTLGFLELALALKFLSIADQAYHWNLLGRDVYLSLWITIFGLLGLYLIGKIKLPHDSDLPSISVPRLIVAVISFSFSFYLMPGLWGAPLSSLSGYLPPLHSQEYKGNISESTILKKNTKYSDFLHIPHGINGYFDLKEALAASKKEHKPIFIDFTGHACVNCREMEARVWADPLILQQLKSDYIVLALYVDDKTELPENEWFTSKVDQKIKKSIGKQNADYQIEKFQTNAQPYYILMDENENLLAQPQSYNLDVANFDGFLKEGLEKYKK